MVTRDQKIILGKCARWAFAASWSLPEPQVRPSRKDQRGPLAGPWPTCPILNRVLSLSGVARAVPSSASARTPRFSSQRRPIATCLKSFLSWPIGSLRACLSVSAACRLSAETFSGWFMATPLRAHEDSHFVFRIIGLSIRQATPSRLVRRPAPELSTAYPQLPTREPKD
jgi:hypothetical protein